jgi:hypothetical protein
MTQETPDPRDSRNAGKDWSDAEMARVRNLSIGNTPMRLIVRELGVRSLRCARKRRNRASSGRRTITTVS